jgi:hypothetical protein
MKKRWLILPAAVVAAVAAKKATSGRQSEWHGLTESEARAKLDAKLPDRIPEEKRTQISDKVVTKMRDRGIIVDDADANDTPSGDDAPIDLREGATEAAQN